MTNLKWSTMEYEEKERSTDWYWALGIIVVASSIASIIFHNYFFAILLILGGGCFIMFSIKKPEVINFEMNDKGIQINHSLYEYNNIRSFFVRDGEKPALFLKTKKVYTPFISASINSVSVESIRNNFLEKNVPEEEMKENLAEKLMERLGL